LQQTFVRALRAFPSYRDRGIPFGAWLFRIARNLAADAHRRKRASVSWELLPEALRASPSNDLDTHILQQEARARVRSLLGALPVEERDLILLRFVAGLTLRQIAAVIGKRESTVHKKIVRTLRTLKERYDADE
jgi:RNA polymerase sigma-70 factor (ECF subfamily)